MSANVMKRGDLSDLVSENEKWLTGNANRQHITRVRDLVGKTGKNPGAGK